MRGFLLCHGWALLLLAVLPALWFSPMLAGFLPDFMDTVTLLYPLRQEVARQLGAGTLPLWNPHQMMGMPLAANPHPAVWYPPNLLFYLLPTPLGNGMLTLLHYWWGAAGVYFLTLRLTRRSEAGFFAALNFQFGSMLISRLALMMHLFTMCWVPWALLAAENLVRGPARGKPVAAVCLVAVLAIQFLGGAPQISYYTLLILPVYFLIRLVQLQRDRWKSNAMPAILWALPLPVIFFFLVGIQLQPTLEFLSLSERSPMAVERLQGQALQGHYQWTALLGGSGTGVEDTDTINAIGHGLWLLVPLAFLRRRSRKAALALLIVGVAGYALAWAVLVPLWAKVLPFYGSFNAPRRALMLWSVAGPVIAGIGAANLLVWMRRRRWPRAAGWAVLGVLTIPTVLFLPRLERNFTRTERFEPSPMIAAEIGDERFFTIDPSLRYSYDSRRFDYGTSLMPNLATWHGLDDVQGYDVLVPRHLGMFRNLVSNRTGIFYPSHGVYLTNPASPWLELSGVNFLLGRYDLFRPGLVVQGAELDKKAVDALVEPVVAAARWPLYKYREPRPRAWIAPHWFLAETMENALIVAGNRRDPRAVAAVEEIIDVPRPGTTPPPLQYTREDARTVRLVADQPVSVATLWVLAETWMPGWKATTPAGESLQVLRANGFQIGVVVPAGTTAIAVQYAPVSFWRGLIHTAAGLILCALLLLIPRLQKKE